MHQTRVNRKAEAVDDELICLPVDVLKHQTFGRVGRPIGGYCSFVESLFGDTKRIAFSLTQRCPEIHVPGPIESIPLLHTLNYSALAPSTGLHYTERNVAPNTVPQKIRYRHPLDYGHRLRRLPIRPAHYSMVQLAIGDGGKKRIKLPCTRWQLLQLDNSGRHHGQDQMIPFRYNSYSDNEQDDRTYMRYLSANTIRRPLMLRSYQGTYYPHRSVGNTILR